VGRKRTKKKKMANAQPHAIQFIFILAIHPWPFVMSKLEVVKNDQRPTQLFPSITAEFCFFLA
jgi:hypothetical protein